MERVGVTSTGQFTLVFNLVPCCEVVNVNSEDYQATGKGKLAVGVVAGQLIVIDAYVTPALGYTSVSAQQLSEAQPDARFMWSMVSQ